MIATMCKAKNVQYVNEKKTQKTKITIIKIHNIIYYIIII